MILNQSQAEAVYSAMQALNNVNGLIHVSFLPDGKNRSCKVYECTSGMIAVDLTGNFRKDDDNERYPNQNYFAIAYGLTKG